MPIWRRKAGIFERGTTVVFWPLTSRLPRVGRSISAISLSSVLLPAPGMAGEEHHLAAADVER